MGIQFFLLVAAGGAIGSVLRAFLSFLLVSFAPWPTLLVNLLGAFFIGIVVKKMELSSNPDFFRAFWIVGLCGGFTTFSTFGIEILQFFRQSEWLLGSLYLLGNLVGSVVAILLGLRFYSFIQS